MADRWVIMGAEVTGPGQRNTDVLGAVQPDTSVVESQRRVRIVLVEEERIERSQVGRTFAAPGAQNRKLALEYRPGWCPCAHPYLHRHRRLPHVPNSGPHKCRWE